MTLYEDFILLMESQAEFPYKWTISVRLRLKVLQNSCLALESHYRNNLRSSRGVIWFYGQCTRLLR